MIRLPLPRGLFGQFAIVLLLALLVFGVIVALISGSERSQAIRLARHNAIPGPDCYARSGA